MSERANIAAKRLGKKSASTLHDPKAAAAQAIVHLDDDLHKVGKDTQTAAARLQAQFRGHHARAMSRLLSWEMEKVTKLVVDTMRGAALAIQEAAEGGRQGEAGGGARHSPLRQRQVAAGEGAPGMGDDVSNEEPW